MNISNNVTTIIKPQNEFNYNRVKHKLGANADDNHQKRQNNPNKEIEQKRFDIIDKDEIGKKETELKDSYELPGKLLNIVI